MMYILGNYLLAIELLVACGFLILVIGLSNPWNV